MRASSSSSSCRPPPFEPLVVQREALDEVLAKPLGLRVGEIKALRWREVIDLIARTITVKQHTCRGLQGPHAQCRRRSTKRSSG